jgi:hypothetical protein
MTDTPFIDYSQWKEYTHCEWKWLEKYVHHTRKARKGGQQEDALTLGSLVHSGLESLRKTGTPTIGPEPIATFDPTPECLAWAQALLLGYTQAYPNEQFTHYYTEEPLTFGLASGGRGLAKIDSYFHLDECVTMESGVGDQFTLTPGWWIHEYKTKDAGRDTGKYVRGWRVNNQANFQLLALWNHVGEKPQGILVNVLEKPKDTQPVRKCPGCEERIELRNWVPTGGGYNCPLCGFTHTKLDTTDRRKVARIPAYYRLMVTRTMDELEVAAREIDRAYTRMQELRAGDPPSRALERCMEFNWECDYFEPHSALNDAAGQSGFVQIAPFDYINR